MDRSQNPWKTRIIALAVALLLSACLLLGPEVQPTADNQAAYTAAAETVVARLTLESGLTAVAQLTEIASPLARLTPPDKQQLTSSPASLPSPIPTDTPPPPTNTPPPTSTAAPPTATPPGQACDLAEMVGDVTLPPDSTVVAGSAVSKVWRVRNVGTCTWDTGYTLNYTGGNLVGSVTTIFLPASVPPGGALDLAVPLVAPAYEGVFQSTWMLRNTQGQNFGAGTDASIPLLARLRTVRPASSGRTAFDLAAYACSGEWRSSAGRLACPGQPNSAAGFVLIVDRPLLESRQASTLGLWTRPDANRNGWIQGKLPLYAIQAGDHFLSEIGCLSNSPGCDVSFDFSYQLTNGANGVLGRWREVSDGQTTPVDLDLSALAGQPAYLILGVTNNGLSQDANAVWLQPRVGRQTLPGSYNLTWTREGASGAGSCDELRISLSYAAGSATSGFAQAYDCSLGSTELAGRRLAGSELSQVLSWVNRLESFSGEVYTSAQGQAILSTIYLQGFGSGTASDADIQALANFSAQIFNDLAK